MKSVKIRRRTADASFVEMKVLVDSRELRAFEKIWNEKKRLEGPDYLAPNDYPYSLLIETEGRRELWLYHPSGLTQVLSKAVVPIYLIVRMSEWHELLGVRSLSEGSSAKVSRTWTRVECERELRVTLTRALKSSNAYDSDSSGAASGTSIAELEKLRQATGPSMKLAIRVLSLKDPREGRSFLVELLRSSEGLERIHAAAMLALLGFSDGVSALKSVEGLTSSHVEFLYAKAALLLLGEPIPPNLATKSSANPDFENLLLQCQRFTDS